MLVFLMSLFAVPAVSDAVLANNRERYNEDLTIRPLADGKVVTAFTFRTLLGDTAPRDPRNLESLGGHTSLFHVTLKRTGS